MNTAEIVLVLAVAALAGIALYVAIKAHLHHATLSAEVSHQADKIENVGGLVKDAVQAEVAAVKSDIAAKL